MVTTVYIDIVPFDNNPMIKQVKLAKTIILNTLPCACKTGRHVAKTYNTIDTYIKFIARCLLLIFNGSPTYISNDDFSVNILSKALFTDLTQFINSP